MHRYSLYFSDDGDYVLWQKWETLGHFWSTHGCWLIPGSQIDVEDE